MISSLSAEDSSLIVLFIDGSHKIYGNLHHIVDKSDFCFLSQLSTPNGLFENLDSSFTVPLIPLTQSRNKFFIFSLSQENFSIFSNLSSSLVLIQINGVLDFAGNSKFLHQEIIIQDQDYFLLQSLKGNLLSEIIEEGVAIDSFFPNNCGI